ncbi:two-component sensor histidine kinase [Betaproteobacteria bacterium]|nr:two-component sensor histidine kinase [Betaproteobacteria bacterium]
MPVPQTLLGRTFLFFSLLIFVSGITWSALFSLAEREPRAGQLAQLTVSVVNLTRAALIAADPEKRLALLQDLADREGVRLYPEEASDVVIPLPDSYFFDVMREAAVAQLGPRTRFASEVNGLRGMWVSFSLNEDNNSSDGNDDNYWLMLPGARARGFVPWQWLGWGVASLALALLVTWLTVFRVTRPLRDLADAAKVLGQGRYPEHVSETTGASEFQQVTEAFNRMSDDLKRNAAERTAVLAGLSHDLRTPLARLRLESELSIADESAREAVAADIEQMDAIIAQFLAYARGEGDETPVDSDINALVEQIASHRARVSLAPRLDLGELPPARSIRPKALTRAITNLLDNARKYAAEPFIVKTRHEHGEIIIDVLDSGPGIPETELERIKRPFTRLENARTDTTGTGLGLAIVERIAHLHSGKFELLNRPEGGLIGRLRLPVQ